MKRFSDAQTLFRKVLRRTSGPSTTTPATCRMFSCLTAVLHRPLARSALERAFRVLGTSRRTSEVGSSHPSEVSRANELRARVKPVYRRQRAPPREQKVRLALVSPVQCIAPSEPDADLHTREPHEVARGDGGLVPALTFAATSFGFGHRFWSSPDLVWAFVTTFLPFSRVRS